MLITKPRKCAQQKACRLNGAVFPLAILKTAVTIQKRRDKRECYVVKTNFNLGSNSTHIYHIYIKVITLFIIIIVLLQYSLQNMCQKSIRSDPHTWGNGPRGRRTDASPPVINLHISFINKKRQHAEMPRWIDKCLSHVAPLPRTGDEHMSDVVERSERTGVD